MGMVNIPDSDWHKFKTYCTELNMSMSECIRRLPLDNIFGSLPLPMSGLPTKGWDVYFAAPKLLEACEAALALMDRLDMIDRWPETVLLIDSAVKEARGES